LSAIGGGARDGRSAAAHALAGFTAPRWLWGLGLGDGAAGGNLQTIWSARFARCRRDPPPRWLRRRWTTPDGDFVDVDFAPAEERPRARLVLFHGLEGSSRSHYAQSFADAARRLGWDVAVPHFRGCSGELNLAPRAYHSGDHHEVGWMLDMLDGPAGFAANSPRPDDVRIGGVDRPPMVAVGISLGGNALLRWAQEAGEAARRRTAAVAAICSPIDLAASGRAIGRGFNRLVYTRMFLATMKPKALAKLAQHPGLFDRERLLAAGDLYAFDDVFTAPLHGFRGTDDYWARASAAPHLHRLRVPSLVLNAANDPFVPVVSLPRPGHVSGRWVDIVQPRHGGHVGFARGTPPGEVVSFADEVCRWLGLQSGAVDG
jgi:predicted alpha/beta-fold hydrolase